MKNRLKIAIIFLFALTLVLASMYIFYLVSLIASRDDGSSIKAKDCQYHVLILGGAEDENFLDSIYSGAESVSANFNCVVEMYVPKTYSQDKSIKPAFEYASYINPDGIIACISENNNRLEFPRDRQGKLIPLITLSQYQPEVPQITYIGTNYSELGRKIAQESSDYLSEKGRVAIIGLDGDSNPNYSTLMNSLTMSLSLHQDIQTRVLDFSGDERITSSNALIRSLITQKEIDLIVCLTEEDTIRIAQLVSEINSEGKIGIIGFGSGEILDTYLNKGTISELLSIDSEKIGRMALSELFEYMNKGYANNYISSDVKVRRSGK